MKEKGLKRLLSLVMTFSLLLSLVVPVSATEDTSGEIAFEKVDSSIAPTPLVDRQIKETDSKADSDYADTDIVRVSIVLEKPSTIEAGYSTTNIAANNAAMNYRGTLEAKQETVTSAIERVLGEELNVVWNLTLAANLISAYVEYGKIAEIESVPGVASVVIETQYAPAVVSSGAADPSMATSSAMIGSTTAYLEGYTGAGSRIAIIDTGIDDDHQSFDAGAYEYALSVLAEKAGMSADEYVAGLNLLTAEEVASVADQLNASNDEGFEASKTYLSAKVPYAYNYIDDDFDINHDNDKQGEHGSHVTGIAAANSYIPDGEGGYVSALESVLTQGVAPEAQIITMKVFGKGGGAYDSDYMAAIEDAIILGADAVNLSLGSAYPGFSYSSKAEYQSIMESLSKTDTVVSISAGNSYSWPEFSNNFVGYMTGQGYLYSDGVSMDTVGTPGSITNSLAVASADNTGFTGTYMKVGDDIIGYTETTGYGNDPMTSIAGEQKYILINSAGTEEEFAAVADELLGKIAVCWRGDINFAQKANNAVKYGAIGVIIANNVDGTINMDLTGYTFSAPCVSITQADGDRLLAAATPVTDADGNVLYYEGDMTVSSSMTAVSNPDADVTMSDFSSWGVPGSLELKPEITAPGGDIYSVNGAVAGGEAYELMSGTSMAAPQIAGMTALLAQYIEQNNLDASTGLSKRQLAQSLLMSTAVPLRDADNGYEYYSVLKQGAGLANVGNAVSATSYIRMGSDATDSYADGKVKAELGDDPGKTGSYSFSFTINNLTDTAETYALTADLFTQGLFASYVDEYGTVGNYMDTGTVGLAYGATWTVNGKTLNLAADLNGMDFNGDGHVNEADGQALLDLATGARESIYHENLADLNGDEAINSYDAYLFFSALSTGYAVVPANGSVTVQVTLSLTEEQKAALNERYPTGAYVEGYVYATAVTSEDGALGTAHSIPVLGYYGNWTDSSMYDLISWSEYYSGDTRWNYMGTYYSNYVSVKYAGDSTAYAFGGNPILLEEYDEARNALNSENGDVLANAVFSLIRNAAAGKLTVTNTTTGKIEFEQTFGNYNSAFYSVNSGAWQDDSDSVSLNFTPAGEEGDSYEIRLTMAPEYYVDDNGNVNWDALGDGAALSIPFTIDNTAPEVSGITGTNISSDGGDLEITAQDNQYISAVELFNADGTETLGVFPVEQSQAGEAQTVTIGTEELEDGVYLLQVYDYAMNVSTYRVFLNVEETDTVESITISPASLTIMRGATATLTATVLPENVSDVSVTWTSSDESIATVNENGIVTGVEKGECVITATSKLDDTISAECAVTVNTAAVTLYGALQDEDGNPLLFSWDMENDSTWTPYAELDNDIASVAWDWLDGDAPLYQQNSSGNMYKVDVDTGETLARSAEEIEFGAPVQDMDFAFYNYSTTGEQLTFGVYGAYLLGPNAALDNTFATGWNLSAYLSQYTGASKFVAIAWGGIDSSYRDCLYALDDAGYLWILRYDGTTSIGLGLIPTDLNLSFPTYNGSQYCSMVFDDDLDVLYLSYFTGSTNELYMLEFDGETGFEATLIGDVGDSVWPTALFWALPNAAEGESLDSTARANKISPVSSAAVAAKIAVVESEAIDLVAIAQESAGGLNSVISTVEPNSEIAADNTVTVTVTAKDATGADVASTNGVATVTYNPEILTLVDWFVSGDYTSQNIQDGSFTFGYVNLTGAPAGETVAQLTFRIKDLSAAATVTIEHKETNDKASGYLEELTVKMPTEHKYGEPVFVWSEDYFSAKAVFTCEWCGDTQTVEAEITSETTEATKTEDGKIVYTATVTFEGKTYTDTKTVVLPATGEEDPTKPGEPEDPTKPTEPEDPTKPGEPEDPTKPAEPEDPTKPVEPEDPSKPTTPGSDIPKTGDNANLPLWTGLMVLSAIAVAVVMLLMKQKPGKFERRK